MKIILEGGYKMATKQNKTLNQFGDFLTWVEKLRGTCNELWLKPISTSKWSLREILTHIMYWDRNSLDVVVPNMVESARLSFVDIEKLNQEAALFAQSYTDLNVLIGDVLKTRLQLLELLKEKYNDSIQFTIDNKNYTFEKFVNVFIHHDEHHIKQVEAFLEQENS